MITTFRRSLGTWAVRLLFLVLVAAFAVWGVGDVFRMMGHDTWVARIGSRTFEAPEVQAAYQRQMAQVTRMMQGQAEPTPEIRRSVLNQTLDRLVTQAAILQEAQRLGHRRARRRTAQRRSIRFRRSRVRTAGSTWRRSRRCCATTG